MSKQKGQSNKQHGKPQSPPKRSKEEMEYELEKLRIHSETFQSAFENIGRPLIVGFFYILGLIIFLCGIYKIVENKSPETIRSIGDFVASLGVKEIIVGVAAILFGAGWILTAIYGVFERKGKKRAIAEKAKYQKIAEEQVEPDRTTSGLTGTGETPKT